MIATTVTMIRIDFWFWRENSSTASMSSSVESKVISSFSSSRYVKDNLVGVVSPLVSLATASLEYLVAIAMKFSHDIPPFPSAMRDKGTRRSCVWPNAKDKQHQIELPTKGIAVLLARDSRFSKSS